MKVLIADDEKNIISLFGDVLEMEGFDVVRAEDGQECLEKAAQSKPDVILLDVNMPIMDGWEACKRLKADPVLKSIPVIFISAQSQKEDKEKGVALGGHDYLTKPVDLFKLAAYLRKLGGVAPKT